MKRILCVHNYYGSAAPSGENLVFDAEVDLLSRHGNEIRVFARHSDEIREKGAIGRTWGGLASVWNPFSASGIRRAIEEFKPEIIHAHNTFPLISSAIFSAARGLAPRVLTLHNYRLFCPAAIPMRSGHTCTMCLDRRSVVPSLIFGCYRGSRIATVPLAAQVALNRFIGTWEREVDAFIVLSEFQREVMAAAGLPENKLHVKPNFYPGNPSVMPWKSREPYVVFVGRLSSEKGLETLLHAWADWGSDAPELRLVGDGPLRSRVASLAATSNTVLLGQLPSAEAELQIAGARLLVLPSECFEGFPMVVREAFALGTPVAVSNLGPLPAIVQDGTSGVVFEVANHRSLLARVRTAWNSHGYLASLGIGARAAFERLYNERVNYESLLRIYERAIAQSVRARK